jgi:hypothetical protein
MATLPGLLSHSFPQDPRGAVDTNMEPTFLRVRLVPQILVGLVVSFQDLTPEERKKGRTEWGPGAHRSQLLFLMCCTFAECPMSVTLTPRQLRVLLL